MESNSPKSRLEVLSEILLRHGVEFIVIGGEAAAIHGSPLATFDSDICYRRSRENLERLARALIELRPSLRGAPPYLKFAIDAASLALGNNYTFTTAIGDVDMLGMVEPIGGYEAVARNAVRIDLEGLSVLVISLDDLIRVKQHIRRPKDQAALMQLLAIKRLREQGHA